MISYRVVATDRGATLYCDGLHSTPVKIAGDEDKQKVSAVLLSEVAGYFNESAKGDEKTRNLLEELLTAAFKAEEVSLELVHVGDKVARRLNYPDLQGFLREKLGKVEGEKL